MSFANTQLGHYKLLRVIGSGGMGEVYLAEDTRIARQVAVKIVSTGTASYPDSQATEAATRLLEREIKAIISLDHPHILPLFDFGEEGVGDRHLTYLVMPFRPEGSLTSWLRQRQRALLPQEVSYFISQAADALQHAHDRRIIHQDVKPSNFLIRAKSAPDALPDLVLTDFGVSKLVTSSTETSQAVRGTAAYMPPEQWQGAPVPATDQYALAIMAYQLLTGRPPFLGSMEQVMHQHFAVPPPSPRSLNSSITPALETVLLRALSKQPADRFVSITAFARAFEQALSYKDLHATIALSPEEGRVGTVRTLTLPGARRLPVNIPAGAHNGQVMQITGQGDLYYDGGPAGSLFLNINIVALNALPASSSMNPGQMTPVLLPAVIPPPPPSIIVSSSQLSLPVVQQSDNGSVLKRRFLIASVGLVVLIILSSVLFYGLSKGSTKALSIPTLAGTPDSTATFLAKNPDPYPPHYTTLALYDPLIKPYWWSNSSNPTFGGSCQFANNGLQAAETKPQRFFRCDASMGNYGDFDMDVHMQILQGSCGDVLFRGNFAIPSFYTFSVCSDGTYFLRYYKGNQSADAMLIRRGSANVIKTGFNQTNIVGLVAAGDRFDLYINQTYVGSVSDSNLSTGQFALGADSRNDSTEVVFTNIRVWNGNRAAPALNAGATAAVAASNTDPYPPGNWKLALYDPLSQPMWWANYKTVNNCEFTNGSYHVLETASFGLYDCISSANSFNNFAFEVQMRILKGDCGDIAFRGEFTIFKSYLFRVCQTGRYLFVMYRDPTGKNTQTLRSDSSGLINTGLNQSNIIGVVASGSAMGLYINHNKIADINDSTYSAGRFALIAESQTQPTEVAFSNAKIWTP